MKKYSSLILVLLLLASLALTACDGDSIDSGTDGDTESSSSSVSTSSSSHSSSSSSSPSTSVTPSDAVESTPGLIFRLKDDDTFEVTGVTNTNVTNIVVGNYHNNVRVTSIATEAFSELAVQNVVISEGIEEIGDSAFFLCENLVSVSIPTTIKSIGTAAFSACYELEYNVKDNGLYLGCSANEYVALCGIYDKSSDHFVLNSDTKLICDSVFSGYTALKSLVWPSYVTTVDNNTFANCTSLESITFHNTLEEIGDGAFSGCSSLDNVVLPDSLLKIGKGAFKGCSSLSEITLPVNLTDIGAQAFYDCTSLTEVTLSSVNLRSSASRTNIKDAIFGMTTETSYPDNYVLVKATISEGVKRIPELFFTSCRNLGNVEIPTSVETLADRCFNYSGITEVVVPSSVTYMGANIFHGTKLRTAVINAKVKDMGSQTFFNNGYLESVTLPDTIEVLKDRTFCACPKLKSLTLPANLKQIDAYAFGSSRITDIVLPEKVELIAEKAFIIEGTKPADATTSITFSGSGTWYITGSKSSWENKDGGSQISVSIPANNVVSLTETHVDMYWYKS